MSEQALGPTHPDTALSLWWIATLLTAAGDRAGARARLERALAIYTHALGPAHPTTHKASSSSPPSMIPMRRPLRRCASMVRPAIWYPLRYPSRLHCAQRYAPIVVMPHHFRHS